MKIKNEKPPIWDKARAALGFDEKITVFTYGDTIYNPTGFKIGGDLIAHESVHEKQQAALAIRGKLGPWRWWRRYLKDPKFRMEQELAAYRAQYKFAKPLLKDANIRFRYLMSLATHLSGPMYGNVVGLNEACHLIKDEKAVP